MALFLVIWLPVFANILTLSQGQTETSRYYEDIMLIMEPYKNAGLLGTITGTAVNLINFTQDFVRELIVAIKNIKLPPNLFYSNPPQTEYNTSELIGKFLGYPVEDHYVVTSDGYILGLQRIPSKRGAPVVLFLHGLLVNNRLFVINSHANQNLPTILSNEGFDVWLLNYRGAPNSMQHVNLSQNQAEFWDFSINEESMIDLPQTIDYILRETGVPSLSIVGHSLGSTNSFALLSERPDYNIKVKVLISLAPIAKVSEVRAVFADLLQFSDVVAVLTAVLGTMGKILPGFDLLNEESSQFCKFGLFNAFICQTVASVTLALGSKNLNVTLIPVILNEFPTYTSVYVLEHFGQIKRDDTFQAFDFREHNIDVYGQRDTPPFDVRNIAVPVALFSSEFDILSVQKDIEYLRNNLRLIVKDLVIPKNIQFSHYDLIMGENANELIYPSVLEILKMYNGIA